LDLTVDGRITRFFPDPRTVGPHYAGVSIIAESGHENIVMKPGDQALALYRKKHFHAMIQIPAH
jgi:hypothetical protein